ncbi:bacillithiol system redox-active protein YtxJ [Sphingobacterium sp. Mn56C]|uniref:bacillithiol system redox-active protein YtxJ n=1 Tax=Sphingobacterium sp. Mn56C TaxID=3395261 RepID=UPI003BE5CE47
MNWTTITQEEELQAIYNATDTVAVLFKHSTRCPVSSMAKRSLEFDADQIPETLTFYYLDLIRYRPLSNKIAELWGVQHESPQIIVVKGNTSIYHASHSDIEMRDIIAAATS